MGLPIPFGNPTTYPGHSGVDYPGHAGKAILASGPGRVVSRGKSDRGGFYVWVQYDNGPLVGYHHMNSHDGVPPVRSRVSLGSQLGFVGWTGKVVPAGRAGAHLHSEVSGHWTTPGYWLFFDRDRVVGDGSVAGGDVSIPAPPLPAPTPNPEPEIKETEDMDRLMLIDPTTNGAYYVVNYRKGTAIRIWDPYQLAFVREEIKWEAKKSEPSIIEQPGPQPLAAIRNLTIING